jgi:hypothetical protein
MADDGGTLVTITLPASPNVGDIIQVNGVGSGGWTIVQNAGQSTIVKNILGSSSTSTTGPISGAQYDAIELQYIASNTFSVLNYVGNVVAVAALPTGYVYEGGLTWMPISSTSPTVMNWTTANTYCTTTVIDGLTGWRLPTQPELSALSTSGAMNGLGWTLYVTWSSTPDGSGGYIGVNLATGRSSSYSGSGTFYATCVR